MFFTKEEKIYLLSNEKVYEIKIENGIIKKSKSNEKYDNEFLFTLYELKCKYASLFLVDSSQEEEKSNEDKTEKDKKIENKNELDNQENSSQEEEKSNEDK